MPRRVVIVPHTHWDREWYAPFQTFRLRLVELLDELLPTLEADPSFAHFMLDGQMAVVDDYLAIRPAEAERLRRLAMAGRLGMGPWYVLMDEFLVSGETIIRNLQLGLDRAAAFGGASEVGYLPDMFGHIAQMPQLLRQFGLDHTVVWRGVPNAIDRTGFVWQSPDGSTVRAEYLPEGYGNGASLPGDAKDLIGLIDRFVSQYDTFLGGPDGPVLWMNGTDHLLPQPWLGRVVAEANEIQDDYELVISSLESFVASAPTEGLPGWIGELRSGARSNLLMGVASNRVDVKQAAAAAERALERYAEPLSALYLPASRWPGAFLDEAWLQVIRNSAHDSSGACSHDEVNDAVIVRYQEARQIAEGLTARATETVTQLMAAAGPVAINPSARARHGLIEVERPGHEPAAGTQVVAHHGGADVADGITRTGAAIAVRAALDSMATMQSTEVSTDEDGVLTVELRHDPAQLGPRYDGPVLGLVQEAARADPTGPARVTVHTPPAHTALVHLDDVPGFGWASWRGEPLSVAPVVVRGTADRDAPELLTSTTMTNGLVTVVVDGVAATFSIDGVAGLGRLVDEADSGDTYNFNRTVDAPVVDEPVSVDLLIDEAGPLRARVKLFAAYHVEPELMTTTAVDGRNRGWLDVVTTIEVIAGSPLVRVTVEVDNRWEDHRLRAWFPLPHPADHSSAECAFAVVERGLVAEGGATEQALPTYPSRRFVIAGGLTIVHDGLLEYELVDVRDEGSSTGLVLAHALALTLLRCTGAISQGPMAARPLPAGPRTPTPNAQMPGRQIMRYGVQMGDAVDAAYAAVDDGFVPFLGAVSPGGGAAPDRGQVLSMEGAEVSMVVRQGGRLVLRVFNPSPTPTAVSIADRRGWLVDLRGRTLSSFDGSFALGPCQLATASLDPAASSPDGPA